LRAGRSNLAPAADEGDEVVVFSPPAELFGVDGIIVLIVVVLVLFGSTQIPKLARSLGSAQKEFKKGLDEGAAPDGDGKNVASTAKTVTAKPVESSSDGSSDGTS
jgi:sec-independent protein translocase protein TatA